MSTSSIEMVTVESSMLSAVGYDASTKELIATYRSGGTWRYREVPRDIYAGLLEASSKGVYMHMHVLDVYADYRVSR